MESNIMFSYICQYFSSKVILMVCVVYVSKKVKFHTLNTFCDINYKKKNDF